MEALRQGAFVGFVSASLSPFLNIYWITGAVVAGVFAKGPIGGTDNTDKRWGQGFAIRSTLA